MAWHIQDCQDFEHAISEDVEGMATFQRSTWRKYLPNTVMAPTGQRFTNSGTLHSYFCSDPSNDIEDHVMPCFLVDGICYIMDGNKCKQI